MPDKNKQSVAQDALHKDEKRAVQFLSILNNKETIFILEFLNRNPDCKCSDIFNEKNKQSTGYAKLDRLASLNLITVSKPVHTINKTYQINFDFLEAIVEILNDFTAINKNPPVGSILTLTKEHRELQIDFALIKYLLAGFRQLDNSNFLAVCKKISGKCIDDYTLKQKLEEDDSINFKSSATSKILAKAEKSGLLIRVKENKVKHVSANSEYISCLYSLMEQIANLEFTISQPKAMVKLPRKHKI